MPEQHRDRYEFLESFRPLLTLDELSAQPEVV